MHTLVGDRCDLVRIPIYDFARVGGSSVHYINIMLSKQCHKFPDGTDHSRRRTIEPKKALGGNFILPRSPQVFVEPIQRGSERLVKIGLNLLLILQLPRGKKYA